MALEQECWFERGSLLRWRIISLKVTTTSLLGLNPYTFTSRGWWIVSPWLTEWCPRENQVSRLRFIYARRSERGAPAMPRGFAPTRCECVYIRVCLRARTYNTYMSWLCIIRTYTSLCLSFRYICTIVLKSFSERIAALLPRTRGTFHYVSWHWSNPRVCVYAAEFAKLYLIISIFRKFIPLRWKHFYIFAEIINNTVMSRIHSENSTYPSVVARYADESICIHDNASKQASANIPFSFWYL